MSGRVQERGEIKLRSLLETLALLVITYLAFQIGPAVFLQINFVNEIEIAANSPIEMTAGQIKQKLMETAEGFGLTLFSDKVNVVRDKELKRTIISIEYQILVPLWPGIEYVWNVKEEVSGYYL